MSVPDTVGRLVRDVLILYNLYRARDVDARANDMSSYFEF